MFELIRHGARTPSRYYKGEDNSWAEGYDPGALTAVGQRQPYLLGRQMFKDYSPFFQNISTVDKISVKSSNYQRTYSSAESHLAGLFNKETKLQIDKDDPRLLPNYKIDQDIIDSVDTDKPNPAADTPIPIYSLNQSIDFEFLAFKNCGIPGSQMVKEVQKIESLKQSQPDFGSYLEGVIRVGKKLGMNFDSS